MSEWGLGSAMVCSWGCSAARWAFAQWFAGVVEDRGGVDAAGDGAAGEDLLGHVVSALDGAELGDGGVRVVVEADALAAHLLEGGAGARDVLGLAVAVALLGLRAAEAVGGLLGAGDVRVVGVVRDAGLAERLDPLVDSGSGAAVARAGVAAVEDMLHGEVDVDAGALARDLDAVAQRRDGAVGPAAAAVLSQAKRGERGTAKQLFALR